jgi:hypothetical protein
MKWDEIRTMAADPLVTICAHTKGHFAISKLSDERADEEMAGSADRIEQELGRPIHFSFPYGDPGSAGPRDFALAREAGFKTAGRRGRACCSAPPAPPHGSAPGLPQRRISVAHLYGALSVGGALCLVEPLPAHRLRSSVGALHPADEKSCRDDPGKTRRDEIGKLHPMRGERDTAGPDYRRGPSIQRQEDQEHDGADQLASARVHRPEHIEGMSTSEAAAVG